MKLSDAVHLTPAGKKIIEDYYGGWIHRYRAIERLMKAEDVDSQRAQLMIKLMRSAYAR